MQNRRIRCRGGTERNYYNSYETDSGKKRVSQSRKSRRNNECGNEWNELKVQNIVH